ncbi:L-seryl-tRNA(Sec) selenium transferase [Stieleria marina]|uniref:L-seryl-tRNA(Sec) selenium transferase n=1 Tax=Stieleria marina TaxID=1930275 RepID=A0A517NSG3_9BACT|nr:L-seryl-tRNA(Sec) selenium transferase [Planctomycetes bacterium K23_9]
MNKTQQLRELPSVDEVLHFDAIQDLALSCPRQSLVGWVRQAIDSQRQLILSEESGTRPSHEAIVEMILAQADLNQRESLQHVINATGIMLHTNLGRAPLAARAIQRVRQASAFSNVELDLDSGKRSKRGFRVTKLLQELTGAEAALVVNNCAAATMLVLQTMASGKEVVISRGQLVEIGGGFRLPNVFSAAGVKLCEIGTTNRTHVHDYEAAIGEETAAIMRVHHSNFAQIGFVTEPTIAELISSKRPESVPVIDDVGSGCVGDLSQYGIEEPDVIASVAAGADVTLFSGDKLFGGPQAGIIVGREHWIRRMSKNPLMRAIRVDKMTLAALEATTEIHLAGNATQELPLMQMLSKPLAEIQSSCQQVVQSLRKTSSATVSVVSSESQVGGGSVPGVGVSSHAIKIQTDHADQLCQFLRSGRPAVQGRITDGAVLLDLRTVADEEINLLTGRINDSLAELESGHAQ